MSSVFTSSVNASTDFVIASQFVIYGVYGFLICAVLTLVGGSRRWANYPWIVLLSALISTVLIAGALFLVASQAIMGQWSLAYLFASLMAWVVIGPATDELLATLQYLKSQSRNGCSLIKAIFGAKPRMRRRMKIEVIEKDSRLQI